MSGDGSRVPPSGARENMQIALLFGCTIAVCYQFVDRPAAVWARGLDPLTVAIFKSLTVLGSSTPYLVALAPLYLLLRFPLARRAAARRALFVIAAIVSSGLTVDLIKGIVARWRPISYFADPSQYGFAFFKIGTHRNSFPSGHATTVCAIAFALSLLYPRQRVWWVGIAVVVALSRVIIGVHFPGDVLAGVWFGAVFTAALSRSIWFRDALSPPDGSPPWSEAPGAREGARRS